MKYKYWYFVAFSFAVLVCTFFINNYGDNKSSLELKTPKHYQINLHKPFEPQTERISKSKVSLINSQSKVRMVDSGASEFSNHSLVPWEEIQKLWMDELRDFITSVDSVEGEAIFQSFLIEKRRFNEEEKLIGKKLNKMWQQKPLDRKLQKKLFDESADSIERYKRNTKKIFGKHYLKVQKFSEEFNHSIQLYSRDMPVSVEIAF